MTDQQTLELEKLDTQTINKASTNMISSPSNTSLHSMKPIENGEGTSQDTNANMQSSQEQTGNPHRFTVDKFVEASPPTPSRRTTTGSPGPAGQQRRDQDERLFGIPKYQSHITGGVASDRSYNYDDKYPPDEPGQETGDSARVWKIYLDEAEIYDDDMVKGFRDTIDSLLVFAALFSAVVTTFVVDTSQALQPDYGQISSLLLQEQIQILRAGGNVTAIGAVPSASLEPSYTSSDMWVNGLFFTSLSLSLATALLSVLVKQWIQAYTAVSSGSAKSRALVRQFRFTSLIKWKLSEIIGILPLLLHGSVAIFLIGLALHVRALHTAISWSVILISGLAFAFYFGSVFLPIVRIDCPYQIPVLFIPLQYAMYLAKYCVYLARILFKKYLWQFHKKYIGSKRPGLPKLSLKAAELKALETSYQDKTTSDVICWLHDVSSNSTVSRATVRAITSLPMRPPFSKALAHSQIAETVWRQIRKYKDGLRDVEKYPEVWIPAVEWLAQDDAQSKRLRLALHDAAYAGNYDVVKALLKCGANVNQDLNGRSFHCPLQAASGQGHLDVVKALIENGADANAQGGKYGNALQVASRSGHLDIVKVLTENGADVNAQGGHYGNALQAATIDGHLETVKLLLDKGADLQACGGLFGTALQAASLREHLDVMKALIESGADVNAQGGFYGNVLQAASANGHWDNVKLLLDKGADVNGQGGGYGNALKAASYWGHLDAVKLLIDKGADVQARGGLFETALQAAVQRSALTDSEEKRKEYQEIIALLRQRGATE